MGTGKSEKTQHTATQVMRGAGMTAYKERLKICDVPNLAKQQLMLHRIILYMVQVLDEHK